VRVVGVADDVDRCHEHRPHVVGASHRRWGECRARIIVSGGSPSHVRIVASSCGCDAPVVAVVSSGRGCRHRGVRPRHSCRCPQHVGSAQRSSQINREVLLPQQIGLKGEFWPQLRMWFGPTGLIAKLVPGCSGPTVVIGG
jgi:hypothetical protein